MKGTSRAYEALHKGAFLCMCVIIELTVRY